jgi:hypothetical protein
MVILENRTIKSAHDNRNHLADQRHFASLGQVSVTLWWHAVGAPVRTTPASYATRRPLFGATHPSSPAGTRSTWRRRHTVSSPVGCWTARTQTRRCSMLANKTDMLCIIATQDKFFIAMFIIQVITSQIWSWDIDQPSKQHMAPIYYAIYVWIFPHHLSIVLGQKR